MTSTWTRPVVPTVAFAAGAMALGASALLILGSSGYAARPEVVAPALAVDLALGLPLLGYLFLVRTGRVDALALVPLGVAGLALARWWIPAEHLDGRPLALLPVLVLEGLAVTLLVLRARVVLTAYRRERGRHPHRRDAWRAALAEAVGRRVAAAVTGEVEAVVYAVTGWRRPRAPRSGLAFPGHTRGGYPAVLTALLMAVAAETVGVHWVVASMSVSVAWVLSGLGVYSGVWLVGDLLAGRHNPTVLRGEVLHLRTGLRWSLDLPLDRIVGVHDREPPEKSVDFVFLGRPDFWLECREPVEVTGPFGLRRRAHLLGVGVDDAPALRAALASRGIPAATSEG